MGSKFGWVDFAEEDRQKMLDIIHLFREQDTRDELGIGTVRDSFSDYFFPARVPFKQKFDICFLCPGSILILKEEKFRQQKSLQQRGTKKLG